jgi:hypothetical protein
MEKKRVSDSQSGATLVSLVLLLFLLLGFMALAVDAGRWYLTRAELSKAVDAAALVGARNISNPQVGGLVDQVARANFGLGNIDEISVESSGGRFFVEAKVNSPSWFARLFGIDSILVKNQGAAVQRQVEIMMILDRSGSMRWQPWEDLKVAAKGFLDFFKGTQGRDKIGLITFATGVTVDFPLGHDFVNPIKAAIDSITIPDEDDPSTDHDTNMEDAIDQSDDAEDRLGNIATTFTNPDDFPQGQEVSQFLIFFSDGVATSFRGSFTRNGVLIPSAVVPNGWNKAWPYLQHPYWGESIGVECVPTGDGLGETTKWDVFWERGPVPGYTEIDDIPKADLVTYVYDEAAEMAIEHAQELKDNGIIIYSIGLGNDVDQGLLRAIASDPDDEHYHYAPDSDQLEAIFNTIASKIRLRLVQ